MACAMPSRCRMPPEYDFTARLAANERFTRSSSSPASFFTPPGPSTALSGGRCGEYARGGGSVAGRRRPRELPGWAPVGGRGYAAASEPGGRPSHAHGARQKPGGGCEAADEGPVVNKKTPSAHLAKQFAIP